MTAIGSEYLWLCPTLDSVGFGTTTVTDLSGNGRNFTLNRTAAWVTDISNGGDKAFAFATNDRCNLQGFDWSYSGPITLSYWIDFKSNSGGRGFGADLAANATQRLQVHPTWWDWNVYFDYGNVYTNGRIAYQIPSALRGVWNHFALTSNGNGGLGKSIWVNGVRVAHNPGASGGVTIGTSPHPFDIAAIGGNASFHTQASMDDFRMYRQVIPDADVPLLASRRGYKLAAPNRRRTQQQFIQGAF